MASGEPGELFLAELPLRQRLARLLQLRGIHVDARRRRLSEHADVRADAHDNTLGAENLGERLRRREVRQGREQTPFRFRHGAARV